MSRPLPHVPRAGFLVRERRAASAVWVLGVSLGAAAGLGLMLYLVTTSLPYFAETPTTDARFGALNHCLLQALREPRVGFAVAPGGRAAAAYGGTTLAVCTLPEHGRGTDARPQPTSTPLSHPGVQTAAFDGDGGLWFFSRQPSQLWRLPSGERTPRLMAELPLLALAGHPGGVLVVEYPSRLLSLTPDGEVRGQLELRAPLEEQVRLAVNSDATLAALVTAGGWVVVKTADAALVRAEAPCDVEYLWWLESPTQARVACGPEASWALTLDVISGTQTLAPPPPAVRSTRLAGAGIYVESCDGLPCTSDGPRAEARE